MIAVRKCECKSKLVAVGDNTNLGGGAVEQCFPVSALVPIIPPICEGCGSTCGSLGVKAFMHFDSGGNIDAGFSLGSCSGGNPLSKEIKDKFNCN